MKTQHKCIVVLINNSSLFYSNILYNLHLVSALKVRFFLPGESTRFFQAVLKRPTGEFTTAQKLYILNNFANMEAHGHRARSLQRVRV